MEVEVNEAIKIAAVVIIFAVIVGIAGAFISASEAAVYDDEQKATIVKDMEAYRVVCQMDNKTVSSGDIIQTMLRFNRMYDYKCVVSETDNTAVWEFSAADEAVSADKSNYWTQEHMNEVLTDNLGSKNYIAKINRDTYGNILGFIFIEK